MYSLHRLLNYKKICFVFLLVLVLVYTKAYAVEANNFTEFSNYMSDPAISNIEIIPPTLLFTDNLQALNGRTLSIKSYDIQSSAFLSGNNIFNGIRATNNSNLSFEAISFQDMSAPNINNLSEANSGGALFLNKSKSDFSKHTVFSNNKAAEGGAAYLKNSSIVFNDSSEFNSNLGFFNAGAIYAKDSNVSFNNTVTAIYNISSNGMGGAFALQSSTFTFNSDTDFIGNQSRYSGGAVLIGSNSEVYFDGINNFSSNHSLGGGAITIDRAKVFFRSGGESIFKNNTASSHGGVFEVVNSDIKFSGKAEFKDNNAQYDGGAFHMANSNISFEDTAIFQNNISLNSSGGAFFLLSSTASFTNASFVDNQAFSNGGAFYAKGTQQKRSYLNFITQSSKKTIFQNNIAAGISNAIYLDSYSDAVFNTEINASVEMYDGIASALANTSILIKGEGNFNFYGDASNNFSNMIIATNNGGSFNLMEGSILNADILTINSGSFINMQNSQKDIVTVRNLNNSGTLQMDILPYKSSDQIIASENVYLDDTTSVLEISSTLDPDQYRRRIYKLINYQGNIAGKFSDIIVPPTSFVSFDTHYGTLIDNWITLTLQGSQLNTNFQSLSGLNFNQKQTAKTFDILSQNSSGDLDTNISLIEAFETSEQKNAFQDTSGYFLANLLKSGTSISSFDNIFSGIKKQDSALITNNNFWGQLTGNISVFKNDKNVPDDYKDISKGIMVGYNKTIANYILLGVYGKYNSHNIKQSYKNKADISSGILGFHGGYIENSWEINALIAGSLNNYSTERYVPFINRTAKADFGGSSFSAELEGSLKFRFYDFFLKPSLGLDFTNSYFNCFKENGAQSLDLNIYDGGNYSKTSMNIGVSLLNTKAKYNWYISAKTKFILDGAYSQISGKFKNTDISFESRSSEESIALFGIGAGANMKINSQFNLFAESGFNISAKYKDFNINLGLCYSFYTSKKAKEYDFFDIIDSNEYAPPPPCPEEGSNVRYADIILLSNTPDYSKFDLYYDLETKSIKRGFPPCRKTQKKDEFHLYYDLKTQSIEKKRAK